MKQMTFADAEYAAKRKQTRKVVHDRDRPGGAVEGFDGPDRATLPEVEWWSSGLSADGDVAYPSDAKLVRLQRSSNGGGAVRYVQ